MDFRTKYKEEMMKKLKQLRPDVPEDKLELLLKKKMVSQIKNPKMSFEGRETNGLTMIKFIEDNQCIMSPFGTLFQRHENADNILASMVDMLLKERKVAKKKMFNHKNDEDQTLFNNYKMLQLTLKLLANSFYGASIESNSIFYHPYFGPSITYCGVNIITTAVNVFEKFVANNIMFRTYDDIFEYICNIIEEDHTTQLEVTNRNVKEVHDYLVGKLDEPIIDGRLREVLEILNQEELNRIYYKNNLNEIIVNSNQLQELLRHVVAKDDFLDPNEPPEHYQEYTNKIWDIIKDWVYYDKLDFYRWQNADERVRKAILTIDTDSNFIYLQPFVNMCFSTFRIEDTKMNRMTTTNIAGWLMGNVIKENYALMTKNFGIPKDKRPIINMKNEFYYNRIMLTKNKKNYGGIIGMQEGVILKKPDIDLKGLAIKKVSVTAPVRNYFTDMLVNDMLTPKNISLSQVISRYQALDNRIKNSLLKGEIEFLKPDKVNMINTYKTPYQIQSVRGTLLWNSLYPNKEISIPNKINIIKTTLNTREDIENANIPQEFKDKIFDLFSDTPELEKYGATVIGIPKTEEHIPDWLIPYIDTFTMVNDSMKPGKILLETLGFKEMTVMSQQIATNIIDI